jgi:hypothetical protein
MIVNKMHHFQIKHGESKPSCPIHSKKITHQYFGDYFMSSPETCLSTVMAS